MKTKLLNLGYSTNNSSITSTTFCWLKQVTRTAQTQGVGWKLHLLVGHVVKYCGHVFQSTTDEIEIKNSVLGILSNTSSLTPTDCPTIQFNSDTNDPE